ncbi:DUF987 family protein [Escherichia coli]
MRIHQQHPASRLFPFCTGKYRWHGLLSSEVSHHENHHPW